MEKPKKQMNRQQFAEHICTQMGVYEQGSPNHSNDQRREIRISKLEQGKITVARVAHIIQIQRNNRFNNQEKYKSKSNITIPYSLQEDNSCAEEPSRSSHCQKTIKNKNNSQASLIKSSKLHITLLKKRIISNVSTASSGNEGYVFIHVRFI